MQARDRYKTIKGKKVMDDIILGPDNGRTDEFNNMGGLTSVEMCVDNLDSDEIKVKVLCQAPCCRPLGVLDDMIPRSEWRGMGGWERLAHRPFTCSCGRRYSISFGSYGG